MVTNTIRTAVPDRIYSDFSFSFTPHPVTGDITILKNDDAIKNSIKNLVKIRIGEKPFNPDFGTGIHDSLFETFNSVLLEDLKYRIENVLLCYEPRAKDIIIIFEDELSQNAVTIHIIFKLLYGTKKIDIDVILEKIR